ncbi:MAG: ferrochelatase [Calditrichaeota bacterium]|nr:ferrochelatase [Calditrichota bacterium]
MKQAILLVNMGGPARRIDVEPYLREIFSDPAIIDLPAIIRKPLASLIARRRAGEVAERYEDIGGYSPLFDWTEALRQNLLQNLNGRADHTTVKWAFRYISPTIPEAMAELAENGVAKVFVLPLFPHYTHTMTGSVMKEVERAAQSLHMEYDYVEDWGQEEVVLSIWRDYLLDALQDAGPGARVMFVAHGIPKIYVNRGDNYPDRVRATAGKLAAHLPVGTESIVAFQSKVGPVEWTKPYMEDVLEEWAQSDAPIVMMPLSFVSDCLETLYDLDTVAKEIVESKGVKKYIRVRVFNDDLRFSSALLSLIPDSEHAEHC